jgi:hypothetical protein
VSEGPQQVTSGEEIYLEFDIQAATGGFTTDHVDQLNCAFDYIESLQLIDGQSYFFRLSAPGCADLKLHFTLCSVAPVSQEYTECGGAAVIYVDPAVSLSADVVAVSGVCYELTEESSQTAIDTMSIDDSYSDCASCQSDQGAEIWLPCTPVNVCDGNDCGGSNEPNIQLTVFDADYAGGNITWCGQVWTPAEVQAGATKCACPTTYVVPAAFANANQWIASGLKLYHDTLFSIVAGRKVILSPGTVSATSVCNGSQNNCADTSAGVFAGSPIRGCLPKVNPTANFTTSPAVIEDCQFLDHTVSGVNYKWEKGINW